VFSRIRVIADTSLPDSYALPAGAQVMHTPRHAAKLLCLAFLTIPQTLLHSTPPELSTRPPLAYEGFRNTVARESHDRSAREKYLKASNKGLSLLKKSSENYPNHRQCFSCHHQTLPLFAMHIAGRGVRHGSFQNEGLAIEEFSFNSLRNDLKNTPNDEELDGRGLTLGYGMWLMDLSRNLHPEDKLALIRKAIATQQPQGHWRIHSQRPPAASSQALATALIVSSLVKHAPDPDLPIHDRLAIHQAIFRAMVWYLREDEPKTTEDACGMLWLASAFRNYVLLDRKTAEISSENSQALLALHSQFRGPHPGNNHLQSNGGPPGWPGGIPPQKRSFLDSQDHDLIQASRLPPKPYDQQADQRGNYKALASIVGLENSNLILDKYNTHDAGELRLAKSPRWRAWLKENYSKEEIISLFQADRRRGLREAGRKLIDLQHTDGGWGQAPNLESDPYSTGMTLLVLKEIYSDLETYGDFQTYGGENSWELQRFIAKRYLRWPPNPHSDNQRPSLRLTLPSYPHFEFEHRALKYLLKTQKKDGSWHVSSRATPVQEFFDNGDPHETDQFISIMATAWATAALANAWIGQPAPLSY
jgi:hypothetical protein